MINKQSLVNENLLDVIGELIDRMTYLENLVKQHCIGVNKLNMEMKEMEDIFKSFKVEQEVDIHLARIRRLNKQFKKDIMSKINAIKDLFNE